MQLTKQQIDYCMECGVCTGSCPISYERARFSPRQMIKRTLVDQEEDILATDDVWACLSCSRCSDRCPVAIDFPEFIRSHRQKAIEAGNLARASHHGIFQTISRLQAGELQQKRTEWARQTGQVRESGEYYYFVGCAVYQQPVFRYLGLDMLDTPKNILRLLNRLDIEPVVSDDERCCGHDAFWGGREELFAALAAKNVETIAKTGAKTVLFGCPEGYSTFREHYPAVVGELPFKVMHISQFLAERCRNGEVSFDKADGPVTFHDPCRLGRRAGIYEEPRELLRQVPDGDLREMVHNRENAVCCGTTAWMECSSCSKAMQMNRLAEAVEAGAETLITACPKCQIHLTCAKTNTDIDLEVKDLYTYLAERLE